MAAAAAELQRVVDVEIDDGGVFNAVPGPPDPAVRSPAADIYDRAAAELEPQGFDCECLGGGRISHQSREKKIHVYGYSVGFGRANHSVTTEKLKAKYPDYEITWADEGY
ncbi:14 kDa phosphohistidine phosphatase isoform X1 [Gallus gallus]|uniref:14 kDa phosphohistidine phosphatase isoform X1 n=1 Tax=Gallus gallus TaxID=9031 RepID=UPI001AE698D6|nr:14 kDa phosphohistidine phosphatase isoform X1 [Gallus gallus]XP_046784998.1 14 kDa phosphohistidine phosphatase isoform X1 [Gallus gallus]